MKEIRNNNLEIITSIEEGRQIEGYALVFNSFSNDLGGFVEIIDNQALDGVIETSDVLALLNHNEDKGVLARSNKGVGSLKLTIDERGLKYAFTAPLTALGDELIEGVKRGDITTSSFAFSVEDEKWTKNEEGKYIRTIKKIGKLYDVSPVYFAAYSSTSVNARGLNSLKEKELKELDIYYKKLTDKIK